MKIIFWISAVVMLVTEYFMLAAFVNVYFKNYNGGPQSSSGSVVYSALLLLALLVAGFLLYFTGRYKWAAMLMGIPVLLSLLYLFFMLILPVLMGGKMN